MGWGLVSVFKRLSGKLKEGGESLGYGKSEDSVPQGDWIAPDQNTGNYNRTLSSNEVGAKGWSDMLNLPSSMQPFKSTFLSSGSQISSTAALSLAKHINKELNAFWNLPLITHHGDEVLNTLQNQPNKTYIYGISQTYQTLFNNSLESDLEKAPLTDTMRDALAKIIMTKNN